MSKKPSSHGNKFIYKCRTVGLRLEVLHLQLVLITVLCRNVLDQLFSNAFYLSVMWRVKWQRWRQKMGWKMSAPAQVKGSLEYKQFHFNADFMEESVHLCFSKPWLPVSLMLIVYSHFPRIKLSQFLSSLPLPGHKRGTWSLVCDTEEQWVSLAESIKDKTSPQDRHLHRVISQNFLPEISSMIEHKVRQWRETRLPLFRITVVHNSLAGVCQPLARAIWLNTSS